MAEHDEAIRIMEAQLDLIAEAMREPATTEDQKEVVHDMLRECAEHRKQLEDIGEAVIEQEGEATTFNTITGQLDRLERLQETYQSWIQNSVGSGVPSASGGANASSSAPVRTQTRNAFGAPASGEDSSAAAGNIATADTDFRGSAISSSDAGGREKKRKDKKDKRRTSESSDVGFGSSGFGTIGFGGGSDSFGGHAFGGSGDAVTSAGVAEAGGSGPASRGFGGAGGWPSAAGGDLEATVGSGSAGWGTGGDLGGWPAASRSHVEDTQPPPAEGTCSAGAFGNSFQDDPGLTVSSMGGFFGPPTGSAASLPPCGGHGGANGAASSPVHTRMPASAPIGATAHAQASPLPSTTRNAGAFGGINASGNAVDSFGGGAAGFGHTGTGSADGPSFSGPTTGSQFATMHIRCPFTDIEHDLDGFKAQFVRAASLAAGVPPHRIHIKGVRPGA
eukprot:TRINITY_DN31386_c0_g1_i1.p1 TRINITY_DN31386_c0_g1~~TRINITY_DN31386_c0_g1_i1.p1  ORF type:complete len:448 (+),score=87.91 TRINITY_DN31386_c0_g1_i1:228-1571(+)